nr:MAG TPA: hypothetical protein [Caudoviricetes sp.]
MPAAAREGSCRLFVLNNFNYQNKSGFYFDNSNIFRTFVIDKRNNNNNLER